MNLYANNAGAIATSATSLTATHFPATIAPFAAYKKGVPPAVTCTTTTIWFGTKKLKIMCALNAIKTMLENDTNHFFNKILRLADLIKSCDEWLTAEEPKHLIPANRVLDTWLFESKNEWLKRYQLKQQVRGRLMRYQMKLLKRAQTHDELIIINHIQKQTI